MPGQIDVAGATIYFKFTTRAFSTGIPTILSSSPVISIYKDDSTTQSTTGVTLTTNFDSVAGLNHVSIDTTADATFYANGHKYYLVITTGTVDSVSVVGEIVGEFELSAAVVTVGNTLAVDSSGRVDVGKILGTASQGAVGYVGVDWSKVTNPTTVLDLSGTTIKDLDGGNSILSAVSNIAVTSAALNATAASATYTTGTSTGGAANTYTLDGIFDSVAAAGNAIDIYYEFDLSATTGATAVGATWDGYLVGAVNTIKVYAYNWGGSSWDQVGNITGIAGTVVGAQEFDLTSAHTGTGGNLGKARIRFAATGLTTGTLKTDRILLGYAVVIVAPSNFSSLAITAAGGMTLADAVAHGGTPGSSTATFAMKSMNVTNSSGDAVKFFSTGSDGIGLNLQGNGNGDGLKTLGGTTGGTGINALAGTGSGVAGIFARGNGNGAGMQLAGGSTAQGFRIDAGSGSGLAGMETHGDGAGPGFLVRGGTTGNALTLTGGSSAGSAIVAQTSADHAIFVQSAGSGKHAIFLAAGTNADALHLVGAGTGSGFSGTLSASTLATLFTIDTTKVYADAVSGSVVKEVSSNASISGTIDANVVEVGGITVEDDGAGHFDVRLADAVTHGGATAILTLQSVGVSNPSGAAMTLSGSGIGLAVSGGGGSAAIRLIGGATGLQIIAGDGGNAIRLQGSDVATLYIGGNDGSDPTVYIEANDGPGIQILTGANDAIQLLPTGGHGISIAADGSGKHGIFSTGGSGGAGMHLAGGAGGSGLSGTLAAGTLATLFTVNTTKVYADAVSGSVVKETAGNATISGTVDANVVQIGGVASGDDVEQTAVPTTFFGRMRQLYNRFFPEGPSGEVVKNSGTHTIVTKDSTGAVITTQPYTDDGSGNETIGPAS